METNKRNIFVFVFFILITLPLGFMLVGMNGIIQVNENRKMADAPKISEITNSKFLSKLDSFLVDNFGLRSELVFLGRLQASLLGVSPSDKVLFGKDGWLFYRPDHSIEYYRNMKPLSSDDAKGWIDYVREQSEKAEKLGAKFFIFVGPNSQSIYGDLYLPDWIKKKHPNSRLDEIKVALTDAGFINTIIDPRKILLAERKNHLVYLKTDTHWSPLGAYFGYVELMQALGLKPKELSEFKQLEQIEFYRDLTIMLGPKPIKETYYLLEPNDAWKAKVERDFTIPRKNKIYSTCEKCFQKKAVFFHDSFMDALQPFLSEDLSVAHFYLGYSVEWDKVEKVKPDFVVQEIVERKLYDWIPTAQLPK